MSDKETTIGILLSAVNAIAQLIDESAGVAGLHRNGDMATWAELRRGGRFESWLIDVDKAFDEMERLDNGGTAMSDETKRDDDSPDRYGNRPSEWPPKHCCYPDCGCDGMRLCQAKSGPNFACSQLNIEKGSLATNGGDAMNQVPFNLSERKDVLS